MSLKKSEIFSLSNRYASALFGAAKDSSTLNSVESDYKDFLSLIESSAEFSSVINSSIIPTKQLFAAIAEVVAQSKYTSEFSNFLLTLAENGRMSLVSRVFADFENLLLAERNTKRVQVTSTKKLSESELSKISVELRKALNCEVECINKVDSSILGGLRIQVESTLFDDSIASKLNRLKSELIFN